MPKSLQFSWKNTIKTFTTCNICLDKLYSIQAIFGFKFLFGFPAFTSIIICNINFLKQITQTINFQAFLTFQIYTFAPPSNNLQPMALPIPLAPPAIPTIRDVNAIANKWKLIYPRKNRKQEEEVTGTGRRCKRRHRNL